MDIGKKIKQERQKANLSQKELGERLGVSQAMIGQYENGKRTPKIETLQKIANALNLLISDLLTYDILINTTSADIKDWLDTIGETKSDKINELFEKLNDKGQDKAIEQVELLTKIPEYRRDEDYDKNTDNSDN